MSDEHKVFTVYNSSGNITKTYMGTLENLTLNLESNESYIEGEYFDEEYKIVDGEAVLKTEEEKLLPIEEVWINLRDTRDILLQSSDWTQVSDVPLTDEQKQAWANYRNALRQLPSNTADPRNPTWPTKPS